jgi:hypothetical protein
MSITTGSIETEIAERMAGLIQRRLDDRERFLKDAARFMINTGFGL